jgi:chromosome segregation ATPase
MQAVEGSYFIVYPGMYPGNNGNKITIPISTDRIANQFMIVRNHFNSLSTRFTNFYNGINAKVNNLNANLQQVKNKAAANHQALRNALAQDRNNAQQSFLAHDQEFQARDRTITAQSAEINNLKQRLVESTARTAALDAQSIEDRTKIALLERKVQNLEESDQLHQAKALETQNKIAQLELQNQTQSKIIDEGQKEQNNIKESMNDLTETLRQLSRNFEAFKDRTKAAQEEMSLKNAQLSEQAAEQEANIILIHKLAAEVVQEDQSPKQESPRNQELKARRLVRAHSAKLLSKRN